jgi:hypothetical protein
MFSPLKMKGEKTKTRKYLEKAFWLSVYEDRGKNVCRFSGYSINLQTMDEEIKAKMKGNGFSKSESQVHRCAWVNLSNPVYVKYHDEEWSRPVHDDAKLYEFLVLETFQAGLSWECILNKREGFRKAFDGFRPERVAAYGEADLQRLLTDSRIIRNRLKVKATIVNSRVFLDIQRTYGSFDA